MKKHFKFLALIMCLIMSFSIVCYAAPQSTTVKKKTYTEDDINKLKFYENVENLYFTVNYLNESTLRFLDNYDLSTNILNKLSISKNSYTSFKLQVDAESYILQNCNKGIENLKPDAQKYGFDLSNLITSIDSLNEIHENEKNMLPSLEKYFSNNSYNVDDNNDYRQNISEDILKSTKSNIDLYDIHNIIQNY